MTYSADTAVQHALQSRSAFLSSSNTELVQEWLGIHAGLVPFSPTTDSRILSSIYCPKDHTFSLVLKIMPSVMEVK